MAADGLISVPGGASSSAEISAAPISDSVSDGLWYRSTAEMDSPGGSGLAGGADAPIRSSGQAGVGGPVHHTGPNTGRACRTWPPSGQG